VFIVAKNADIDFAIALLASSVVSMIYRRLASAATY